MKRDTYCRQRSVNQRTKASIAVYDSWHPESVFDRDGGRWVSICETHGDLVNHETFRLASSFAREPEQFCEQCAVKSEARDRALQSDGDNPK